VLGKEIYLDKYRNDLEDEARWLEFGAVLKANSVETLLRRRSIAPDSLLELGSGTGAVIRECRRKGLAREYFAVDASEEAIAWSRERSPGIRCIVADITDPAFEPQQSVDLVLLSHVLEHLENPGGFLKSLVERMSFEWLIAEVPLEDLLAARVKNLFRDRTKNSAGHVQFFTETSFVNLVASSGLEVVESLRYVPILGEEMLESQLRRLALSPGARFVKRMTFRHLPRLFTPLWSTLYHAHLAVLCRPVK
jgi:SAM-dependent methyltransferase